MKLFLAGAVSTATENQLEKYNTYKGILETFGELTYPDKIWEYREKCISNFPEKNKLEIDKLMVDFDLDLVRNCDIMVCDISQISTGLGIELGVALEHNKKIVFFYETGSYVSNMITGAFSEAEFIEYQNIESLKQSLLAVMNKLK
jgi:nucleoside 2-deoxyribosyltransferase